MLFHSPPFASSHYGLLQQKVQWVIMDTQNVLTPGPHICMTMGYNLHACQYCTCMHIRSDFDQHNTTHSTE